MSNKYISFLIINVQAVILDLVPTHFLLKIKFKYVYHYSSDISGDAEKYLSLPADKIIDTPLPMLFVSFPSSKDPTYQERYPGKSVLLYGIY